MSQPTTRARVQSVGRSASLAQVGASIGVPGTGRGESAADVAQQLLHSFGVYTQARSQVRQEQDQQDQLQGQSDQLSNAVDPEKLSANAAYHKGAAQVQTHSDLARDTDEVTAGAQQYITSGDLDGLNKYIASEHSKRWTGADADTLKVVNPTWLQLQNELQNKLRQRVVEDVSEKDQGNLTVLAEAEYNKAKEAGRPMDWSPIVSNAHNLFGRNAHEVTYRIASYLVAKNHDASIIDAMPDTVGDGVPSIKKNPQYAEAVQALRDKAASFRTQDQINAEETRRFAVLSNFEDRLNAGKWLSIPELNKLGDTLGATAEQRDAWYRRQQEAMQLKSAEAKQDIDLTEAFNNGLGQTFKSVVGAEKFNASFDAHIERAIVKLPADKQLAFVLDASTKNGAVYRPLRDTLNNPDTTDATKLQVQAKQYRQILATAPNQAHSYVPDDHTAQLYGSLNTLEDLGFDAAQRLTQANQMPLRDRQDNWREGESRKAVMKDIDKMQVDEMLRQWSTLGGMWTGTSVKNLKNSAYAASEARRIADALGELGVVASKDAILKTTSELLRSRYMVIDGVFMPRTAATPADTPEALEWFKREKLTDVLKEANSPYNADQVELLPDVRTTKDRMTFSLYLKNSVVPAFDGENSGRRFDLTKIAELYREHKLDPIIKPIRARWAAYNGNDVTTVQDVLPGLAVNEGQDTNHVTYRNRFALTVDDYANDRKFLTAEQRKRLDPQFVEKAKLKADQAEIEAMEWRSAMGPKQPNGKLRLVDIDKQRSAEKASAISRQWSEFAARLGGAQ